MTGPETAGAPMTYHRVHDPALVREALRRAEDFTPTNALTAAQPLNPAALRVLARSGFALPPVLASATGPLHRGVRSAVARFFSPARVAAQEEFVRALTAEVVARELPDGSGNLARVTRAVPAAVLARTTGLPAASMPAEEQLHRWSLDSLTLFWGRPSGDEQLALAHSCGQFYAWLGQLVEDTREDPTTVFGAVAAAGVETTRLRSLAFFLLIAGQSTTGLLVNTVLHRTLADAHEWQVATADATAAVDTALATESSVPTWRRACPAATQLGGHALPAGTELLLELTGHGGGPGLAFGHGLHRCLGAGLARAESIWITEEIARALPGAYLDRTGPCGPRLELLSFSAPLSVPVRSHPPRHRRNAP